MLIRSAVIAFGVLAASSVFAQATATKILAVRSSAIVRDAPQIKAAEAKLKSEFEKRGKDLEAQGKAFTDDVKAYQREGETMTADQRARKEKDLNARQVDLNFAKNKLEEDFANRRREVIQNAMEQINTVIVAIGKEKGADMVVQDPIYTAPGSDITTDVVKRLTAAK